MIICLFFKKKYHDEIKRVATSKNRNVLHKALFYDNDVSMILRSGPNRLINDFFELCEIRDVEENTFESGRKISKNYKTIIFGI